MRPVLLLLLFAGMLLMRPVSSQTVTPTGKISGTIMLEGVMLGDPSCTMPPTSFVCELTSNTTAASFSRTITFTNRDISNHSVAFMLNNIPLDSYTISIKGAKWLRVSATADVTFIDVSNLSFFLPGGDANNDNSVDISDFGIFINAYGSSAADPTSGYDINADFTCDGLVDIADFGIITNEYGTPEDLYQVNLSVQNSTTPGQITLGWMQNPANVPFDNITYNLYRSTTTVLHGSHPYMTNLPGSSFTDTNVDPTKTYYYQMVVAGTQNSHSVFGLSNQVTVAPVSPAISISASAPYVITCQQPNSSHFSTRQPSPTVC